MIEYQKYFQEKKYELLFQVIGSIGIGLLLIILFCPEGSYLINFLFSSLVTFFAWSGNTWIFSTLAIKYPLFHQNTKRILLSFTFITLYTNFILFIVNILTAYLFDKMDVLLSFNTLFRNIVIATIVTFFVAFIYESIRFYTKWKEAMIETETLKKENLKAELESLKSQISPHFLFNSLNALASIIPENSNLSVQFVEKLSHVYRYVLQYGEREKVLLSEELSFVESYLFLQGIRFGENIKVEIDISDDFKQKELLPLTLQLLVENAIKHNIVSTKKSLFIFLFIENEGYLVVKNNLQEKKMYEKSTGLGLKNIENRYQIFAQKNIFIEKTSTDFIVKIPLL